MEDDEIIIGINKQKDSNKKKKNVTSNRMVEKQNDSRKRAADNAAYQKSKHISKKKRDNVRDIHQMHQKQPSKKMKILMISVIGIIATVILLSSSLFNIQKIYVEGNEKLSDEEIISLSKIQKYNNIFGINQYQSIQNIKENAYIEEVKIKRKLPDTIQISVKERVAKYMLQFADSYVYINNQGYMLEISNQKLEVPTLIGFTTDLSNIQAGNRMNIEDLKKMDMVIKIFETANSNDIGNLITKIDISNDKNYTLILETEGKTVYLGDCSELNTRIVHLKGILEAEVGKRGEVFLNMDINTRKAYFREAVQ